MIENNLKVFKKITRTLSNKEEFHQLGETNLIPATFGIYLVFNTTIKLNFCESNIIKIYDNYPFQKIIYSIINCDGKSNKLKNFGESKNWVI
jgi:hypothetical protein